MCSHAKINVVMNIRELFNQSPYHLHQNLQLKKQHVLLIKKMYVFNHEGQNQEQSSTINIENNRFFTQSILFLKLWV